ncbi:MAG: hypothetical protein IJX30_02055 [Clostridia bacterium]|nr:hypothetical protein [Clostridia bacterium]
MGALAKYWEDNNRLAEERLRDMEETQKSTPKPIIKLNRKQWMELERKKRENPYTPKKGQIDILPHREEILMYFKEYLHKEWRDFLFANGWRWSGNRKCWVNKYTSKNYTFAYKFITGCEYKEEIDIVDLYVDDF